MSILKDLSTISALVEVILSDLLAKKDLGH